MAGFEGHPKSTRKEPLPPAMLLLRSLIHPGQSLHTQTVPPELSRSGTLSGPRYTRSVPPHALTLLSWISISTWCCRPLPPWVRQEFWGRLAPELREGEPRWPPRPALVL